MIALGQAGAVAWISGAGLAQYLRCRFDNATGNFNKIVSASVYPISRRRRASLLPDVGDRHCGLTKNRRSLR